MLPTSAGVEPATSCLQSDGASNWATKAVNVFQHTCRLEYILFSMLNKYFIAPVAENTFILHWKKNYRTTLLRVKLNSKLAACFFQAHIYLFWRRNEKHCPFFQNMSMKFTTVQSAQPYYVSFSLANEERINFLASSALFPRSLHDNFALITRNKHDRNAEREICVSLDSSTIATRYR